VHLAVLWLCLNLMQLTFELSQATATGVAIIGNFYAHQLADLSRSPPDRARVLVIRIDLWLRSSGKCRIASLLFTQHHAVWWVAGIAGAAMSAVWNYAVTSTLTWRE
jgi:dolichol-phosphate mannosyltransferase